MIKFDFHISRAAREKYKIEQSLFSVTGKVILADYQQARILSEKINSVRRDEGIPDQFVTAGQINALGLLHEIFHLLIRKYEESDNPGVFSKAVNHLKNEVSETGLDKTLLAFVEEFPPLPVYNNEVTTEKYLSASTSGKPNKEIILEEIILLHLENSNPAASNLRELYADDNLSIKTNYKQLIEKTEIFFDNEIPTRLGGLPLFKLLRKPISANPFDLEKQLEFIRTEYGAYLGDDILNRLLRGVDLIREDYKLFVQHGGGEKGTPPVPTYDEDLTKLRLIRDKMAAEKKLSEDEKRFYLEYEKFTEDVQWIPEVVMIAKNVYVWLHQLSEKYKREIKKLDQVPDEELDQLTRWNFNSLWLIGIWERSPASQKIKHLTGNISAVSSAYSLYDYVIAEELGGELAFQNLKDRAWARGIRMASGEPTILPRIVALLRRGRMVYRRRPQPSRPGLRRQPRRGRDPGRGARRGGTLHHITDGEDVTCREALDAISGALGARPRAVSGGSRAALLEALRTALASASRSAAAA